MAILGCNLDETENFHKEVEKLRRKIIDDQDFRLKLSQQTKTYQGVKDFFSTFIAFLQYELPLYCHDFYRVRRSEVEGVPYSSKKDLIYPSKPNAEHKDRMNNTSFRVLYTSFHEFTAMAENRMGHDFIARTFQLTRFTTSKPLKVYELGLFSDLYLNSPGAAELSRQRKIQLLGSDATDRIVRGYSALECAMAEVLYDQTDGYHYLSSILADAIFSNTEVDAILYPSVQNRYGVNIAFRKECADSLDITYSSLNRLEKVYRNGFYQYRTEMECLDFSNPEKFTFSSTDCTRVPKQWLSDKR